MKDVNEFRFTGTVEQFRRIETRTGAPMISFRALCWKEKVNVIAFKTVAEQTELSAGDRVEVRGHIQTTNWTDQTGQQRSGWQVIATEISKADGTDTQEQAPPPARQQQAGQAGPPPVRQQQDKGSQYAYKGGPF